MTQGSLWFRIIYEHEGNQFDQNWNHYGSTRDVRVNLQVAEWVKARGVEIIFEIVDIKETGLGRLNEANPPLMTDQNYEIKAQKTWFEQIDQHDRVILQFPFYWYSAPPLLKKWLEEVLTYGWAYASTGSKLQNKEIMVAVTTRVDQIGYSAEGDVKYTVSKLLRPLEATSHFVGARFLEPFVLYGVEHHSEEQLQEAAQNYVEYALKEY